MPARNLMESIRSCATRSDAVANPLAHFIPVRNERERMRRLHRLEIAQTINAPNLQYI